MSTSMMPCVGVKLALSNDVVVSHATVLLSAGGKSVVGWLVTGPCCANSSAHCSTSWIGKRFGPDP